MNVFRISFILRSPSLVWHYMATNKLDLAQVLLQVLEKTLAPAKPVRGGTSRVQQHFYAAARQSAEEYKAAICKLLEQTVPDTAVRRAIIVSVTEPTGQELEELRQNVDPKDNADFWAAVQKELPRLMNQQAGERSLNPAATEEPGQRPRAHHESAQEDDAQEDAPQQTAAPQEPETPVTVSQHARKLQELKRTLLERVHGQRHAVDSVVQGVFESEMFSSINPKRKGPLATFLFTGPSGVGKTYLATLAGEVLGRKTLVVDMSEFSDNLANGRFNGIHGSPAIVTGFVRKHPDGILIFDEIEKAHINTIYQFLQILDGGRMMDYQIQKEVSFRNTIIIMTTNAGAPLYEDTTVCDLSAVPKKVILDGLRKDINQQTGEPYFPECINTRMAGGRVILFNHLEPFALLQIVKDELALQIALFEKSSGIKVNYDPVTLSALVLYHSGGTSDARSLRGLARNIVVRELQEVLMQLLSESEERVSQLKEITLTIDTQETAEVADLFSSRQKMQVVALTDADAEGICAAASPQADITLLSDLAESKRRVRGLTDYVLLDPLCGNREKDHIPNDVEDLDSTGMELFEYLREYMPELPVYILDTTGKVRSFETLLARGARGVIRMDDAFADSLKNLSFSALVNNVTFSLSRSSKFLSFNCAQYLLEDGCAEIAFEKLQLKNVPLAGDSGMIARKGENGNLKFDDVVGCKAAKEALSDYKAMLEDPRKIALSGKKMPRGVLLYGPPGTGKTMLAKAMANECNATFIPTTAGAFFGSLVGETEQNIRNLFRKARKYAPSIIFIDEIDTIGRLRTGGVSSVHNEDALNMFLSEMDGFVTDDKRPVFVLAATNYDVEGESGRVLDPAFVRRFDRRILIPLPETDDRYLLLEKSLKRHGIHFGESHQQILKNMAKRTSGMNNADLEKVNANYARILGDGKPDGAAYMDSLDSYRFGEVNKMDPEQLRQTACHEAGHALICRLCGVTPSFLTVVSRGSYGGFMESAGEKESGTYTYQELMDRVCRCLAGRVAEVEVYGETAGNNTGASSDIRKARYFMKTSLNDYAMGEKLYARWTQEEIEQQMQVQYQRTQTMIREHRAALDALTDKLVQQKSMDQAQLEEFFRSVNI